MEMKLRVETAEHVQSFLTDKFIDPEMVYTNHLPVLGTVLLLDGTTIPLVWIMYRSYEEYNDMIVFEVVENVSYQVYDRTAHFTFKPFTCKDIGKSGTTANGVAEVGFNRGQIVLYRKHLPKK